MLAIIITVLFVFTQLIFLQVSFEEGILAKGLSLEVRSPKAFVFAVLGIKPGISHTLSRFSTTELYP
jgi:hypothetical protein